MRARVAIPGLSKLCKLRQGAGNPSSNLPN